MIKFKKACLQNPLMKPHILIYHSNLLEAYTLAPGLSRYVARDINSAKEKTNSASNGTSFARTLSRRGGTYPLVAASYMQALILMMMAIAAWR